MCLDSLVSEEGFHEGEKIWVNCDDGSQRPAIYIGDGSNATFFGGPPLVYVVMADTREGAEVEMDRVIPRK